METTDLKKIEEIFRAVDDPSITANYIFEQSSIDEAANCEMVSITKNLGDPYGDIKYSFPINMSELLAEITKIKKSYATIDIVLKVFAYHPSATIHSYLMEKDLSKFAKFVEVQWDAKRFNL